MRNRSFYHFKFLISISLGFLSACGGGTEIGDTFRGEPQKANSTAAKLEVSELRIEEIEKVEDPFGMKPDMISLAVNYRVINHGERAANREHHKLIARAQSDNSPLWDEASTGHVTSNSTAALDSLDLSKSVSYLDSWGASQLRVAVCVKDYDSLANSDEDSDQVGFDCTEIEVALTYSQEEVCIESLDSQAFTCWPIQ